MLHTTNILTTCTHDAMMACFFTTTYCVTAWLVLPATTDRAGVKTRRRRVGEPNQVVFVIPYTSTLLAFRIIARRSGFLSPKKQLTTLYGSIIIKCIHQTCTSIYIYQQNVDRTEKLETITTFTINNRQQQEEERRARWIIRCESILYPVYYTLHTWSVSCPPVCVV